MGRGALARSAFPIRGDIMHRSRLAGFIIDCKTDDLERAAQFWSAALGYELRPKSEEPSPLYRCMRTEKLDLHLEVQSVQHESRVHLDIETDDIEAEVKRLEALGAKRVAAVHTWCVMEAPTGQRFCIVRPQNENFAATANEWK
jgi:predicted enzyme related to lactoylglutathione lyase